MATRLPIDSHSTIEDTIRPTHMLEEMLDEEYFNQIGDVAIKDFYSLAPQIDHVDILKRKPKFPVKHNRITIEQPKAICISDKKFVYITDLENSRILEFRIDGEYKSEMNCGLIGPWGIAICDQILYVTDIEKCQLISIDLDTRNVLNVLTEFRRPRQLAVNAKEIWVPDDETNEVIIVTAEPILEKVYRININQLQLPMDVKFVAEFAFVLSRNSGVYEFKQDSRMCTRIIKINTTFQLYFFSLISDYFLISEVDSMAVQVYSKTGKNLGKIGEGLEKIPLGIDVFEGKIFVIFASWEFVWMIF